MVSRALFVLPAVLALTATTVSSADVIQHGARVTGENCFRIDPETQALSNYWCNGGPDQLFERNGQQIRVGDKCLEYFPDGSVKAAGCRGVWEQLWRFTHGGALMPIGYNQAGKCLEAGKERVDPATIQPCKPGNPAQIFQSSMLVPMEGEVVRANDRCLDYPGDKNAVAHLCHSNDNQLWYYTFDNELRTKGTLCLEHDGAGGSSVSIVTCTGDKKQKWQVDEAAARIKPIEKSDKCLELGSPSKIATCSSSSKEQAFDIGILMAARSRRLRRIHVQTPLVYQGENCVTAKRDTKLIHVDPCQAVSEQWWEFTSNKMFRLSGNLCWDLSLTDNRISMADCSGQANQQWNWDVKSGVITSAHPSAGNGKCVTFNTNKVGAFTDIWLSLQPCTSAKPTDNQVFRPREFSTVPLPSLENAQHAFCGSGDRRKDVVFLRDTLSFAKNDFKYFVPHNVNDPREAFHFYSNVVLESLSMVLNKQLQSRNWNEADIVSELMTFENGKKALLELGEVMCQVHDRAGEIRPNLREWFNLNSATPTANNKLIGSVNFLRVATLNVLTTALPADAVTIAAVSESIGKSINNFVDEMLTDKDFDGLRRYTSSDNLKELLENTVAPLCAKQPKLLLCAATHWRSLVIARSELEEQITKTIATGDALAQELFTADVLSKAEVFVSEFRDGVVKCQCQAGWALRLESWNNFAHVLLFDSLKPVTGYPLADLLLPTTNSKLLTIFAVWPFFSSDEIMSDTWRPYFSPLSNELSAVRRTEIERLVYSRRIGTKSLEAYFDGRTSDMATLATKVLPRICARFAAISSPFSVCELIKFHTIVTLRIDLQRMLRLEFGFITPEIERLAGQFAQTFGAGLASQDELWTMTGARLLFGTTDLQVLADKALLTTARPDGYELAYTVFAFYDPKILEPLVTRFHFLIDQVSVAHFRGINKLINDRDVAGMSAYLDRRNNATVSDLGMLGREVLPRVCNNPNNPSFSFCQLQDFFVGLQQVVAFEKSRFDPVVSLTELAEVDVRKQLDVIDGENKQFELIMAIQESANQIGAKIQEESDKIQDVVKKESAAVQSKIDADSKALWDKMDDEARRLQGTIEESTRVLEDTIGAAADAIRDQIAQDTKLLWNKMDDESRRLQRNIDENTRRLSTQIGEEAARTRSEIKRSTEVLYNKIGEEGRSIRQRIDQSTAKLYSKIGEEGQRTRQVVQQSTERLYKKIGEEGQKTRARIDTAQRELTSVINTNTARLEGKIDQSTKSIVGTFKTGFTALADYYKSDANFNGKTVLADIKRSIGATDKLRALLVQKMGPLRDAIRRASDLTKDAMREQRIYLGLQVVQQGIEMATAISSCLSIGAWLTGNANPAGVIAAGNGLERTANQLRGLGSKEQELIDRATEFVAQFLDLQKVSTEFQTRASTISEIRDKVNAANGGDESVVSSILKLYDDYDYDATMTQIEVLEERGVGYVEFMYAYAESADVGIKDALRQQLVIARREARPVFSSMKEIYTELSAIFPRLAEAARAAANGQAAGKLRDAASKMGRRRRMLQAVSPPAFKPFYSMAYAGLSKLFMQYRLQRAAFQFCSFYEYKLGGQAPSMCGATKFYTPADIQKMRAYQAPVAKSYTVIAMLPTTATAPESASPAASGAIPYTPRPYLDLERLLSGDKVTFSLPLNDIAWLKKYGWVYRTDTETSLGGVYIQSMQLVLPMTPALGINGSDVGGGDSHEPFDMAVSIDVGSVQRLINPVAAKRTYIVPTTKLSFTSAINAPQPCPTEITNPYHQAAKCVNDDGSSSLCVYEDGAVARTDLLPSLFSTWEISSPKELLSRPNAPFRLALPVSGVDLNVMVLLKVIRVSKSATASVSGDTEVVTRERPASCCAPREYLTRGKCTACPSGSTGALNGYSCQRSA
ncbi:hypothetical protein PINS_up000619 [Pythium insidiosum]|nr:hypothetical protein PINS_up000619 [Pythium insidiosum]